MQAAKHLTLPWLVISTVLVVHDGAGATPRLADTTLAGPTQNHITAVSDSARVLRHSVYLGIAGVGFGISLNYDFRMNRLFSARAGFGYTLSADRTTDDSVDHYWPAFNAVIYYFPTGAWKKDLEIGMGASYVIAYRDSPGFPGVRDHPFVPSLTIGYRNQPMEGGFTFKADFLLVFWYGQHWEPRIGFDGGWTF